MTLARAELFLYALILVRAFYCLRISPVRSPRYTTKGERDVNLQREV